LLRAATKKLNSGLKDYTSFYADMLRSNERKEEGNTWKAFPFYDLVYLWLFVACEGVTTLFAFLIGQQLYAGTFERACSIVEEPFLLSLPFYLSGGRVNMSTCLLGKLK